MSERSPEQTSDQIRELLDSLYRVGGRFYRIARIHEQNGQRKKAITAFRA